MDKKLIKNAGWLIAVKIVQALLSIAVSIISARYLGPSNFGLVSYAASLVSFVTPIALLGLGNIQVQEYIQNKDDEGKILGSSVIMSLGSATLCIAGIVAFSAIANLNEIEATVVVALYSIALFFEATELIVYWFQAKYLNKYYAVVGLIAYIAVSTYKILLLVYGASIYLFAIASAIDYFLISIVLFLIYKKKGGQKLIFDKEVAKRLFHKAKYYIIPNLMVAIFTQTDHIMLKHMIDNSATGYYQAAVYCAGYANFVFTALADVCRPRIFENQKESEEAFELSVVKLNTLIIYLGVLLGVAMSIGAPLVIKILYTDAYSNSIDPLRIVAWFPLFSYIGVSRNIWLLAKDKQKHLWIANVSGAVINVGLNFLLIPVLGISGAAIASLFTQFATNVLFTVIFPPYRRFFVLTVKGFNLSYLFRKTSNEKTN